MIPLSEAEVYRFHFQFLFLGDAESYTSKTNKTILLVTGYTRRF